MSNAPVEDHRIPAPIGSKPATEAIHGHAKASVMSLGLAALGIVFGDIGTSPLYTLKTVLDVAGKPTPQRCSASSVC